MPRQSSVGEVLSAAEAYPSVEVTVSVHATVESARARVAQMRKSKKWGPLPLSYRAIDAESSDEYARVMAKWCPDQVEKMPHPGFQRLFMINTSKLEIEDLEDLMTAWEEERQWMVPDGAILELRRTAGDTIEESQEVTP